MFAVVLVSALSLGASAQTAKGTDIPSPSTWKLNAGASDFGGGPAVKSATLTVYSNTDTSLRWKEVLTDDTGTHVASFRGAPDGKSRPMTGSKPAQMISFDPDGSFHVDQAGARVMDGRTVPSDDKKTLVQTETLKTPDGHEFHRKLIFERVK
jgi:hypothetical protein